MNQQEVKQLLEKYRMGQCSEEEQALLFSWYMEQAEKPNVLSQREVENAERHIWGQLHKHINTGTGRSSKRLWPMVAAVASVIIMLGASFFFFNTGRFGSADQVKHIRYANDIAPGKNTATLTLANGKTIKLSGSKEGVVINASQLNYADGTKLLKDGSDLVADAGKRSGEMTIATPRGGTYQIILQDGTKVWLNAASSIAFPAKFERSGARKVKLSGEAYFKVAKVTLAEDGISTRQVFKVVTEHQEVEVLGTHFNINSYTDEYDTRTTLLEGAVRVTPLNTGGELSGQGRVMQPGEQAALLGSNISIYKIDTEEAISWKKGYFLFNEEPLPSIMRKISRWYDVEVSYTSDMQSVKFEGTVSRFKNVSEILRKFELTGKVHFEIEGRRITVMP
jgi:ferric-dicitrate binding protein FerR (iron transport regulator)